MKGHFVFVAVAALLMSGCQGGAFFRQDGGGISSSTLESIQADAGAAFAEELEREHSHQMDVAEQQIDSELRLVQDRMDAMSAEHRRSAERRIEVASFQFCNSLLEDIGELSAEVVNLQHDLEKFKEEDGGFSFLRLPADVARDLAEVTGRNNAAADAFSAKACADFPEFADVELERF